MVLVLTSREKAAVTAAATTVALAAVALVMVLTTPDDAGANIGAGLVLLLALLGSSVGVVLMAGSGRPGVRVAAAAAVICWVAYLALAPNDTGPRWVAVALLVTAVLALAAGAVLVVAGGRRSR